MYSKEIREYIKNLRPIDDVFFEVLAENKEVCEEILRTILKDDKLIVKEVIAQKSLKNIYGRSVRLDALCILSNGTKCNIEIQRADNDDHQKRVRFNVASIDVKDSKAKEKFTAIEDVYAVYISEFDIFKKGKCIYHVDRILRETGTIVDNGIHEIYVNTAVNDNSDISELMQCFLQTDVNNPKFPKLSQCVTENKSERGISAMESVLETLLNKARAEGEARGEIKGEARGEARGEIKGEAKGEVKGRLNLLFELFLKGTLSSDVAASTANIEEQEFINLAKIYSANNK